MGRCYVRLFPQLLLLDVTLVVVTGVSSIIFIHSISSLPDITSSTEITRLVMAKEIKNMEDAQEQHLKDMAVMRKKVSGVFRVNRALAAFQAEIF